MHAVEVVDLCRTFEAREGWRRRRIARTALERFTLRVDQGEVHGLLGPNGAGKTTLVKILSTILLPTSGSAAVFGHDVVVKAQEARRLIGLVLGGERGHYHSLTARQNLRYWAAIYGLSGQQAAVRVTELLDRFGLADRADSRVETFSRGMKQRLHLARGLVGDSPLLVLDEPTVGMDPVAAEAFRDVVRELNAEGRTILLTTHDMAEAEQLCDRVSLINEGRLLATESPRTLGGWIARFERVEVDGMPDSVAAEVATLPGVSAVETVSPETRRVATDQEGAAAAVMRFLLDRGITAMRVGRPSLAEVYVHVIGDRGLKV
jgi:ABC-2 type transport system ATP-binding protein